MARPHQKSKRKDPLPTPTGDLDRISRISHLLSELNELLKQQGLGKDALRHLKQLQMRVRFLSPPEHQSSESIPVQAPVFWSDRVSSGETPIDFIRREYGLWLGKGLTRAHIRQLDLGLYDALKHWLKKNNMPRDFDLPTKQQMIDRIIAQSKDFGVSHTEEQREKLRLYQAARRRATKAKAKS